MFCEVYLLDAPYQLDRPFDYICEQNVCRGSIVRVPFGNANRLRLAVVTMTKNETEGKNLKPVNSVLSEQFALSDRMLGLCLFLREHTLCTLGEAVRCILPPGALAQKLNISTRQTIKLEIEREAALSLVLAGAKSSIRSEGQRAVIRYLADAREADRELVRQLPGVAPAHITALRDKGIISISESERIRNPYQAYAGVGERSEIILSRQQSEAFEKLSELYYDTEPKCALLHGVTGSGKTQVMMKTIDTCIDSGKRAILMVPEIALTPQSVGIFCKRYGERVAVIHSSLSQGERLDAWRRIRRGEVDLVIGTRSAVFAPLSNIGLIVIDEEHEHTYKSEQDPKYHARDVASYICGKEGALLLLASATPSLESYHKALCGSYHLIKLTERYGNATLPDAIIVDMREELRLGNTTPISRRLAELLAECGRVGEQAILFLNRRGYNSQVSCKACGEVISCPRCSVSLTYHSGEGGGKMLCHLCGYTSPVQRVCPACSSDKLSFLGYGTQKVEGELGSFLPDMHVMRMDADTTSGKLAYDRMLEDFRGGKSDILLGTQMVAKGHDFPRVTLVGVVLADSSLFVSDFRAAERTFSLLTQVIGRAGRAKAGGIAVIQTYAPRNEIIRLACRQDYESFYEGEIAIRRELAYPPFCDLVTLTVTADSERDAMVEAKSVSDMLLERLGGEMGKLPFTVFGPFEAAVYRVNEKYRMRLVIKCRLTAKTRNMFRDILLEFSRKTAVATLSVDMNPLTV